MMGGLVEWAGSRCLVSRIFFFQRLTFPLKAGQIFHFFSFIRLKSYLEKIIPGHRRRPQAHTSPESPASSPGRSGGRDCRNARRMSGR